jgi:hypothetical protein
VSFSEVVIALLDEPRSFRPLRRFMAFLTIAVTLLLLIVVATPLALVWFETVSGLRTDLAVLSRRGLWLAVLMPAVAVLQSWYQGLIVHSRRTRGITEAVVIYLLSSGAVLFGGVLWGRVAGLYVGLTAVSLGRILQTVWLWYRSRSVMECMERRDGSGATLQAADVCAR